MMLFTSHFSPRVPYLSYGIIGGGIIKRLYIEALLFALGVAICILPLVGGVANQEKATINVQEKIFNANFVQYNEAVAYKKVNAAKKVKAVKKMVKAAKKVKAKKKYKKKYTKVKAAKRYKVRYTSSGGKGTGDCWTNSEILFKQLSAAGQKVRIIQYPTSSSSRHRSVQLYQNGAWVNYDYKGNGYKSTYYATSGSSHGTVIKTS
jgi:hypothetical protein